MGDSNPIQQSQSLDEFCALGFSYHFQYVIFWIPLAKENNQITIWRANGFVFPFQIRRPHPAQGRPQKE
jgi:hypothetical protein